MGFLSSSKFSGNVESTRFPEPSIQEVDSTDTCRTSCQREPRASVKLCVAFAGSQCLGSLAMPVVPI
jgi:hypothetical protein